MQQGSKSNFVWLAGVYALW